MRSLIDRYPEAKWSEVPWIKLGTWPTPVERLAGISELLKREVWIKREDLSGEFYGGNKLRQLEILFAQAERRGCRSLVTVGGIGSNHVVATGIYGKKLGFEIYAALCKQPLTTFVQANQEEMEELGIHRYVVGPAIFLPWALWRAWRAAEKPFFIPAGGTSAMSILGATSGMLEFAAQVKAGQTPEPDCIFVPVGSGATFVGLVLGSALAGLNSRIVGVDVVGRLAVNRWRIGWLVKGAATILEKLGVPVRSALKSWRGRFQITHSFLGEGYGFPTKAGETALALAAEQGIPALDITYTAKAFAALLAEKEMTKAERVLFWHTFASSQRG